MTEQSDGRAWYKPTLERARRGELPPSAIQALVSRLQSSNDDVERYLIIDVLGETQDRSTRTEIERFLECPGSPMLSRVALQVLANSWGLSGRYLGLIRRLIDGVDWDVGGDVRDIAISAAGNYLRSQYDDGLFRALLRIVGDGSEPEDVRKWVVFCLARILGDPWTDDVAYDGKSFALDDDRSRGIVARARGMVASHSHES